MQSRPPSSGVTYPLCLKPLASSLVSQVAQDENNNNWIYPCRSTRQILYWAFEEIQWYSNGVTHKHQFWDIFVAFYRIFLYSNICVLFSCPSGNKNCRSKSKIWMYIYYWTQCKSNVTHNIDYTISSPSPYTILALVTTTYENINYLFITFLNFIFFKLTI